MINEYNSEENKFQEVTNQLKQLPKVYAPPDFELNLRRKINQLNYKHEDKLVYKPFRIKSLIPASALAVCAVIAFFLIKGKQNPEVENPFMVSPPLRTEISKTIPETDNKNLLINPRNVTSNDVVIESNLPSPSSRTALKQDNSRIAEKKESGIRNEDVTPGIASKAKAKPFNFNGYENDVDQSLRARPDQYPSSALGAEPGDSYYENGHNVNFGGFNLIQSDERNINELRARMDSIKKWIRENR